MKGLCWPVCQSVSLVFGFDINERLNYAFHTNTHTHKHTLAHTQMTSTSVVCVCKLSLLCNVFVKFSLCWENFHFCLSFCPSLSICHYLCWCAAAGDTSISIACNMRFFNFNLNTQWHTTSLKLNSNSNNRQLKVGQTVAQRVGHRHAHMCGRVSSAL